MMKRSQLFIIVLHFLYRSFLKQFVQQHKHQIRMSKHAEEKAKELEFSFLVCLNQEERTGKEGTIPPTQSSMASSITPEGYNMSLATTIHLMIHLTIGDFSSSIYVISMSISKKYQSRFRRKEQNCHPIMLLRMYDHVM